MKHKKLLVVPIIASLLLTACGDGENQDKGDPGKIKGSQPDQTQKAKNKDSSKTQKGEAKQNKNSNNESKGDQLTKKDSESHNEILAEGEKSEKYGKSKPTAKNDLKKLPKKVQDLPSTTFEGYDYIDLSGKTDISQVLESVSIENSDKIATDKMHDKVYADLEKMYNDISKVNKDHKQSTGINTKYNDAIDKLGKKYFYEGESEGIERFNMYQKAGWKFDQSTLKVTDYGAENVWMYQIDMVNSKGQKTATICGKFYDVIEQLTVRDSHTSDKGVVKLYDDVSSSKKQQYK